MGLFGPPNVQKMKAKGNVKGLIKALSAHNYEVWSEATEALVEIGIPAVEPLIAALEDNINLNLKINAAKVLGKIGDPRAVKPLINLYPKLARQLARPNHPYYTLPGQNINHLRLTVDKIFREALVEIGKPAVEPLIADLKEENMGQLTYGVLGKIGDPRAVKPLIAELNGNSSEAAAWALGKIGDPRAIKPLIDAILKDKISYNVVAEALTKMAWEPDKGQTGAWYLVATGTIENLEKAIDLGSPAVEPLIFALDSNKTIGVLKIPYAKLAAEALGTIGDPRAVDPLIGRLKSHIRSMGEVAAQALGKIGDTRAIEPLLATIKGEEKATIGVRLASVRALGEIGGSEAVDALIAALDYNMNEVPEALGKIGDPRAVEPLIASLKYGNTRFAAAKALVKIYHNDLLDEHLKKKILAERKNITQHHHDRPPVCAFGHEDRVLTVDFPL